MIMLKKSPTADTSHHNINNNTLHNIIHVAVRGFAILFIILLMGAIYIIRYLEESPRDITSLIPMEKIVEYLKSKNIDTTYSWNIEVDNILLGIDRDSMSVAIEINKPHILYNDSNVNIAMQSEYISIQCNLSNMLKGTACININLHNTEMEVDNLKTDIKDTHKSTLFIPYLLPFMYIHTSSDIRQYITIDSSLSHVLRQIEYIDMRSINAILKHKGEYFAQITGGVTNRYNTYYEYVDWEINYSQANLQDNVLLNITFAHDTGSTERSIAIDARNIAIENIKSSSSGLIDLRAYGNISSLNTLQDLLFLVDAHNIQIDNMINLPGTISFSGEYINTEDMIAIKAYHNDAFGGRDIINIALSINHSETGTVPWITSEIDISDFRTPYLPYINKAIATLVVTKDNSTIRLSDIDIQFQDGGRISGEYQTNNKTEYAADLSLDKISATDLMNTISNISNNSNTAYLRNAIPSGILSGDVQIYQDTDSIRMLGELTISDGIISIPKLPSIKVKTALINFSDEKASIFFRDVILSDSPYNTSNLNLTGTSIEINYSKHDDISVYVMAKVSGELQQILYLLQNKNKSNKSLFNSQDITVDGYVTAEIMMDTHITDDIIMHDSVIASSGKIKNLKLVDSPHNRSIESDIILFRMKDSLLHAEGNIILNESINSYISLTYNTSKNTEEDLAVHIEFPASKAAFAALGFRDNPIVDGVGKTIVNINGNVRKQLLNFHLTSDFTDTTMYERNIRWYKSEGIPAYIVASGSINRQHTIIDTIEFKSQDIYILGKTSIDTDKATTSPSITLEKIYYGKDTKLQAEISKKDGAFQIQLAGDTLNIQDFTKRNTPDEEYHSQTFFKAINDDIIPQTNNAKFLSSSKKTISNIKYNIKNIIFTPEITLNNLSGVVQIDYNKRFSGNVIFNKLEQSIQIQFNNNQAKDTIEITSDDTGEILYASGITRKKSAAGPLTALLTYNDEREDVDMSLDLRLKDVTFVDAPEVIKFISLISLFGLFDKLQGGDLFFHDIVIEGSLRNKLISLQGYFEGASFGITTSGEYDFDSRYISLSGDISPFFTINGIPGWESLRKLLTGYSHGAGLLRFPYTISGTLGEVEIYTRPFPKLFTLF